MYQGHLSKWDLLLLSFIVSLSRLSQESAGRLCVQFRNFTANFISRLDHICVVIQM